MDRYAAAMRFFVPLFGLLALIAAPARADILITNVTLYDGTGAAARLGVNVLIKGDKIATVSADASKARGAKVIDGTGKYLIPGLFDAHVHIRGGQAGAVGQGAERKPIIDREAGITAFAHPVLRAVVNAATYIGRAQDLGSVEAGKLADVVLLDADPAAAVANFATIARVIKNGREIDLSKLDLPVNKKKK